MSKNKKWKKDSKSVCQKHVRGKEREEEEEEEENNEKAFYDIFMRIEKISKVYIAKYAF